VTGPSIRWRSGGHKLQPDTDVLRFEVEDLNRLIKKAAGNADLYRPLQTDRGHPADWQALVLSCFAVTDEWTPARLAEQTGFSRYRLARAEVLGAAGYELWPTEIFIDDEADPRNSVHYDLVVAIGPGIVPPALITGTPAERRAARAELGPLFERVLDVLGEPKEIGPVPGAGGPVR